MSVPPKLPKSWKWASRDGVAKKRHAQIPTPGRQSGDVYSHDESPEDAMDDPAREKTLARRRNVVGRGRALFAASAARGATSAGLWRVQ